MKPKILIIEQGFLRKDAFDFLEKKDFDIDFFLIKNSFSSKIKFYHKYINIFKRLFLNDKAYWDDLHFKQKNEYFLKQIKDNIREIYDYIVVIRSDNFNTTSLDYLSKYSKNKLIAYLWDSVNLQKSLALDNSRHLFSRIYCFDKNSIKDYPNLGLLYETNFYYPVAEIEELKKNLRFPQKCISYVGNIADRRDKTITEIIDCLNLKDITLSINIVKHNQDISSLENKYQFNYLQDGISIHDYLKITVNSTIVLDMQTGWQNGFTFRIIEASYLKKKIITTNQFAKELKFYHPDNIFIYNQHTKHNLAAFVERPFFEISPELIKYYRIDNWLKRILDLA